METNRQTFVGPIETEYRTAVRNLAVFLENNADVGSNDDEPTIGIHASDRFAADESDLESAIVDANDRIDRPADFDLRSDVDRILAEYRTVRSN